MTPYYTVSQRSSSLNIQTIKLITVDVTELKTQVPSALQKHSECYGTYKSNTTFRSLIGVDDKGGIMFVSRLYEGSISDKQLI